MNCSYREMLGEILPKEGLCQQEIFKLQIMSLFTLLHIKESHPKERKEQLPLLDPLLILRHEGF